MKEEIKEGYKKTEIGVIPEDWEVKRLGELGSIYNGLSGKNKSDFGSGKPFIPYKNVFDNSKININYLDYVIIRDNEKQNRVKYGDIFFTTSSETPDEVGMSSVVLDEIGELYLNSFCFGFRLHNFDTLLPQFARYLLRGSKIRKNISKLAQGSTRFNLSKTQLLKISIPIPPLSEQQKIASILSTVDEHIEQTDKLIEKTKELKKGLMQKIFSQEIRLKNENGENYPNWEEKRLGNLIEKVNLKYKHIKHTYHNKDVKFEVCTVSNKLGFVSQYDYFVSTKNNYEIASQDKSNYTIVGLGEFAYNPSRIDVGSIGLNEKYSNALVSPLYIVFKCKKDLEKIFLKYWLKTFYFENQMKRLMDVGVRNSLDYKSFSSMIIKLPSLSEQQKIASILSEVDNQIEEYELKKEKLQTLKKGLMQQLLTGKIRVKV